MTQPSSTVAAARGSQTRRPSANHKSGSASGLFTAPAIIWYLVFMLGPIVAMFVLSFYDWPGMLAKRTFTGVGQFAKVFSDQAFWDALRNTGLQLVVAIPVMIPLAFMLGFYLQTKPVGSRFLSVAFFSPGLLSVSAKSMLFFGMLSPKGAVNSILGAIGLDGLQHSWLADTSTALWCIVTVDLWTGIGWTAVLFSSRLASVSPDIYEASAMDGAGTWRTMWRIAFPICKDFVGVATMLQFIWTMFNSATIVLLLTKGGPGTSSTTLSFLVYLKAFEDKDIGYSQAVGVILFAIGMTGMVVIRRALRQNY